MNISAYQHMNIRMSTRGKRPLRNLTPSDKVRAIQRIHNGETKASVSRDIGVPESTLRGWCKNEQKLRFMCRQLGASEQLTPMSSIENPPEKRVRFDNHTQISKYGPTPSLNEFAYNRLPLNGLSFHTNGSNAIIEKFALDEIMKKHLLSGDSASKQPVDNLCTQISSMMGSPIPITQLSMMQNLNLLSMLSPNISAVSNINPNGSISLVASKNNIPLRITDEAIDISKNTSNKSNKQSNSINNIASLDWAKDRVEKASLNFANENNNNNISSSTANNNNTPGINRIMNDSNNNSVTDNNISFPIESTSDVLNFQTPLPLSILHIPSLNNTSDAESGTAATTALLEWCNVFNASLNFLALAAVTAALQSNDSLSAGNSINEEDNILYKELTKPATLLNSANNPTSFLNNDVSNDSYFDSEPEDLSVRSATTSKLSSPANSRCESPVKSNNSRSPLESDGEH